MHLFDLCHGMDHDDLELGLRVACSLFVENITEKDNFVNILKLQYNRGVTERKVEDAFWRTLNDKR